DQDLADRAGVLVAQGLAVGFDHDLAARGDPRGERRQRGPGAQADDQHPDDRRADQHRPAHAVGEPRVERGELVAAEDRGDVGGADGSDFELHHPASIARTSVGFISRAMTWSLGPNRSMRPSRSTSSLSAERKMPGLWEMMITVEPLAFISSMALSSASSPSASRLALGSSSTMK